MDEPLDLVVIGAGAAGIAAARTLLAAGRRVTVLEARDRAGGRAAVDHRLGAPADLGAAWLHFARENPFTEIARGNGFAIDEREPNWGPRACIGGRAPSTDEAAAWQNAMQNYYRLIGEAAAAGRDVALSDVLPVDELRPRFDAVMTWAVGAESREISTLDLDNYAEGGPNFGIPAGLGAVVASAAEGLPIRYGAPVTRIDWGDPAHVDVHSAHGTLRAAAVIVTVPTSVLARGGVRFDPPLPESHRSALEDLPLGVVNKAFFSFAEGVLPPERMFTLGVGDTSRTAHHQLRAAGTPLVMSFFGGDLSRELEASDGLVAFARDELRRMFGADFVAGITGSFATAWNADPYAAGSYSVARPGRAHQRTVLATPVSPRLQFAGEACSVAYFGTLLGAWESGTRAAREIAGRVGSDQPGGLGVQRP